MKKRMMALGAAVALLGLMIVPVLTASAASAAPLWNGGKTYTCTGGNIPPGTYKSILVTGICYTPKGTIVVRKNLTVAPGALLDAVTPGDPPGHPVVPATVLIGRNVFVGKGAVLLLGCSPNISCGSPPGISFDRIGGNLTAIGAQAVVVHSASIGGNFSLIGGGGGAAAATCNAQSPKSPTIKDLEPWSLDPNLDQTPVYSDNEDSTVGGNVTVINLTSCWLGTIRNQVRGSATFVGNTMGDPDAMEILNNLLGGNMTCLNNTPAVQFGDGLSTSDLVRGRASGECGFNVVLPNPAPEAKLGPGVPQHITVRTRSLKTYFGTLTSTNVTSLPSITTTSGYKIVADLKNFVLAGTGLTGSGTFNPKAPPGQSGEGLLQTVYPNGSRLFIAYNTCDANKCSFGGQSGTTTLRFYGTSSANGWTYGTFLITSGGTPNGKLATLAGWGTFFGQLGGPWHLVEHLRLG